MSKKNIEYWDNYLEELWQARKKLKCASCGKEIDKKDKSITFIERDMVICGECSGFQDDA